MRKNKIAAVVACALSLSVVGVSLFQEKSFVDVWV